MFFDAGGKERNVEGVIAGSELTEKSPKETDGSRRAKCPRAFTIITKDWREMRGLLEQDAIWSIGEIKVSGAQLDMMYMRSFTQVSIPVLLTDTGIGPMSITPEHIDKFGKLRV